MKTALAHQRTNQVLVDLLNDASPYGSGACRVEMPLVVGCV